MPLDLWHFRLHQHAERGLLYLRLCELVRGELVGQNRLVLLVGGVGRLEVNDRPFAVEVRDEVDHADEGQVQARDPQLEAFLRRRDISNPRQLLSEKFLQESLPAGLKLLPRFLLAVAETGVLYPLPKRE